LNLEGIPLQLTDTAGLRQSVDPIENLGVARAWGAIEQAEVVVLMIDAVQGETAADREIQAQIPTATPTIRAMNKIDLAGLSPKLEQQGGVATVWLSAKSGAGVDLLRQAILAAIGWRDTEEGVYLARTRHITALRETQQHLTQAVQAPALDLMAEDLRLAQQKLSSITGEVTTEDLLGQIFSRFCIGK
jgi:tRNA modification GTPase